MVNYLFLENDLLLKDFVNILILMFQSYIFKLLIYILILMFQFFILSYLSIF